MNFGWSGKRYCPICDEETPWDYQQAIVEHIGSEFKLLVPVCTKCGNEVGMPKRISPQLYCGEAAIMKA